MKRVVVMVIVVAMLLAAGGVVALIGLGSRGSDTGTQSRPTRVPTPVDPSATAPPRPALAEFYSQQLRWAPCDGEFECATLSVPLDYAAPRAETIDLALLRVPARRPDTRVGSLVVNPGGPGAPGTQYAAAADRVFREPLLDRFDIVGFDPRGTGNSAPVDCLTDEELDDYIATDPDPDDASEEADFLGWVTAIGEGCGARSGDLAGHVSTVEAVRDMDVLRAALGEMELTYFGASYGTKLGATYADLFPDRVGRLVLDGAVDLDISARELSLQQAAGFETALRSYVENCVEETDGCFLGDSVDEGIARIEAFIDEVEVEPLSTGGERELGVGNAFYGIVAPLYNRDYWFLLSQALRAGFGGDGAALLQLSDLYTSRGSDGYTDNSAEAIYAINCLDDPYAIQASEVAANLPEFEEASPTFGSIFAWGLTACSGVQVESAEEPRRIRGAGAPPIVVVGTTRDPATPMRWAESLAEQLESGVLIRRDGDGHTGYNAGNGCVDEAVEAYLIEGTVPADGLSC